MKHGAIAPFIACLVLISGCGFSAPQIDTVELPVEIFEQLDAVLLDATVVSAVIASEMESPEYSSNPPTSGTRAGSWARCGLYRQEIPDLFQVASLARGAVIVQYRSPAAADVRDAVEEAVRSVGDGAIVAPNPDLPAPVVATAWGTMLKLDGADAVQITEFAAQFGGSGPSPSDCPWTVDES